MVKNLPAGIRDAKDAGLVPGSGGSPREGSGDPHMYSCLENAMNRGTWWATVHGVTESEKKHEYTHTHTHTDIQIV